MYSTSNLLGFTPSNIRFSSDVHNEANNHTNTDDDDDVAGLSASTAAAVIDATQVLSDLPTQDELNGLLNQNKQLLELWRSSQAQNQDIQQKLENTTRRLRLSQWERDARERMENILKTTTKNSNTLIPQMESEFASVLNSRDVVHIYLFDEIRECLVCRWGSDGREQTTEVPLVTAAADVVKAYVSGAVLWGGNLSNANSTGKIDQDVDAMAALVAWIPLKSEAERCRGVAKVMYAQVPEDIIVGSSSINDLGSVGKLCDIVGSFCQRHYDLYASQEAVSQREQHMSQERLEMVNFLRHDWHKMDGMFELKRRMRKAVNECNQEKVGGVTIENMRITIASLVEVQLVELLGKVDYVGLYLPSNHDVLNDNDNNNMASLELVGVQEKKNTMQVYLHGRHYLSTDESLAIARYVGSTSIAWNSSLQPVVGGAAGAPQVEQGSLLCIPIVASKCLGVVAVWRPTTSLIIEKTKKGSNDEFNGSNAIDELDQHTVQTYCNHLASILEEDVLKYDAAQQQKEAAWQSVMTGEIIAKQLSQRLSIFSKKEIFFHQASAGLKSLLGSEAAYLFVMDNTNEAYPIMWTVSINSEQVLTLTSRGMASTIMGEVVRTGKSSVLNQSQCIDDPRCTSIDDVPIQNIMCVPLYVQPEEEKREKGLSLLAVPSAVSIGLFVFLNKKSSAMNTNTVDFVDEDLVVAKQASYVVAPLLQAWINNVSATNRKERMENKQNVLVDLVATKVEVLGDVITMSLQLMKVADSSFIFLSAARTACISMLGSTCTVELFVEQSHYSLNSAGSKHDNVSVSKWIFSDESTGILKRTNANTNDEKLFFEALRDGQCNSISEAVYFKVEDSSMQEDKEADSDNEDENDSDHETNTSSNAVLKVVFPALKSPEHFTSVENTFFQQLSRACSTTLPGWIKCTARSSSSDQVNRTNEKDKIRHAKSSLNINDLSDPEVLEAAFSTLYGISCCTSEEDLCIAVADQLSNVVPGTVVLLLPESTKQDVMWWSAFKDHNDQHIRRNIQVNRDNRPYGITGNALDTGSEMFVSDVKAHTNFRADSDLQRILMSSSLTSQRVVALGVLPLVGQNGCVHGLLQVFPNTKGRKTKVTKFSHLEKRLWQAVSQFVHRSVMRLKARKEKETDEGLLVRANENLTRKMQHDQMLVNLCGQAIQHVQANTSSEPSSFILNVQRDLCHAFDFVCVAMFVCLDSEKGVAKTALKNHENSYMYKLPSTGQVVHNLFKGTPEISVVKETGALQALLDELPHISNVQAFVPHGKVALCVPTQVVCGASVLIAIMDQDHLTEELISNVQLLGVPVINSACSAVVTMDLHAKMKENARKLKLSEAKCVTRDSLHKTLLSCKATSDLHDLIVVTKTELKHLFEVENVDLFVLDNENEIFWTLDNDKHGSIDRREISVEEGGVLGSLSLSTRSTTEEDEQGAQKYEPVCFTTNVRNMLARNECPTDIAELSCVFMVPIVTSTGRLLGAIELINRRGGLFTYEDQEIANMFANQISHDIEIHQRSTARTRRAEETERAMNEQNSEMLNVETRLNQMTIQKNATACFLSALSYIRETRTGTINKGSSGSGNSSSSSSSSSSRESFFINVCRSFSATIKSMFGAKAAECFILDPSCESKCEFNSKGVVTDQTQIPTLVPLVMRMCETIFRRKISDFHGDSIESCFAVTGTNGNIICCLHVQHKSSSVEINDVGICESTMPNVLSIVSNLLEDTRYMLDTRDTLDTLSKETDTLHLDFEQKTIECEATELSLQVAECCLTLVKVTAKAGHTTKEEIHTGIELLCEQVCNIFGFDQVVVAYGLNENSDLPNNIVDIDPILLTLRTDQQSRSNSMLSSGAAVSFDSPLLSASTIAFGKTVRFLLNSTSTTDASSLSIDDLKQLFGNVVTTGAVLCSFGHELEAESSYSSYSAQSAHSESFNKTINNTNYAPMAKGVMFFISSEGRLDSFETIKLQRFCSAITDCVANVVEHFTAELVTKVELERFSESNTTLRQQLGKENELVCKLTKANEMIQGMQVEIDTMEQHLQNEINSRLQGEAANSLARTLMLWRQSSTQWYFTRWRNNVKNVRRQRYVVLRITAKMHRGVKGHSFYIWKTLIAKGLRNKRVLRRCVDAMKFRSLHKCFFTWYEEILYLQSIKAKMRRAIVRVQKRVLVSALNTWKGKLLQARQGNRALRHWLLRNMAGYFLKWISNAQEQKRVRQLTQRCVLRFSKTSLARSFSAWCALLLDIRTQRIILQRFAMRLRSTLSLRAFTKLRDNCRQRQSLRRTLEGMCNTFTRSSNTRIRVMWQHWFLHVHFSKQRVNELSRLCAAFVNSQNPRVMRVVLDRLQQNARMKCRVRKIMKCAVLRVEKNSLNSLFVRWRQNVLWLDLTRSQIALKNTTSELDKAREELVVCKKAHDNFLQDVHEKSCKKNVKLSAELVSMQQVTENLKQVHGNVQLQYQNELQHLKAQHDLQKTSLKNIISSKDKLHKSFQAVSSALEQATEEKKEQEKKREEQRKQQERREREKEENYRREQVEVEQKTIEQQKKQQQKERQQKEEQQKKEQQKEEQQKEEQRKEEKEHEKQEHEKRENEKNERNIEAKEKQLEQQRKKKKSLQQEQPVMSEATCHLLERQLALCEARCEKAELTKHRALDHVRHLSHLLRLRRENVQSRLSQLVAMDHVLTDFKKNERKKKPAVFAAKQDGQLIGEEKRRRNVVFMHLPFSS
jgi:hypothetical protein